MPVTRVEHGARGPPGQVVARVARAPITWRWATSSSGISRSCAGGWHHTLRAPARSSPSAPWPGATPTPRSDLDLIIVADTTRPFFERHKDFAGLYDVWPRLDLLTYTPEEFARMVEEERPLISRALEEGVVPHETA